MPSLAALKLSTLAAAASLLASCGGASEQANEAAAPTEADSNVMLQQLGNDASALEAAGNAAPIEEPAMSETNQTSDSSSNGSAGDSAQPVLGETRGGDTGGNTVQGNTTGT